VICAANVVVGRYCRAHTVASHAVQWLPAVMEKCPAPSVTTEVPQMLTLASGIGKSSPPPLLLRACTAPVHTSAGLRGGAARGGAAATSRACATRSSIDEALCSPRSHPAAIFENSIHVKVSFRPASQSWGRLNVQIFDFIVGV
jgi:hypothetical protein